MNNSGMSHADRQWLEGRLNAVKQELREDNRAMEGRITMRIRELRDENATRLDDYGNRIRSLETHRGYIAGIGATLGFVASWIKDLIVGRGGT